MYFFYIGSHTGQTPSLQQQPLPYVWIEGDERRVEEWGGEDGQKILKISIFQEPSSLLSFPLLPSQTHP